MRHLAKKEDGSVREGVIAYYLQKTLIEGGKVISNNELFQRI